MQACSGARVQGGIMATDNGVHYKGKSTSKERANFNMEEEIRKVVPLATQSGRRRCTLHTKSKPVANYGLQSLKVLWNATRRQ